MREIKDTEIRFISDSPKSASCGTSHSHYHRPRRRWLVIVTLLVLIAVALLLFVRHRHSDDHAPVSSLQAWLCAADTVSARGTLRYDTLVGDIPLQLLYPLNATPHLEVGSACLHHTDSIVLLRQAADIRSDNGQIADAFVLRGRPLAWGPGRSGYCAVIDGQVTIGVADQSPLFEQAAQSYGDFFRQYPLVDNGQPVGHQVCDYARRCALCDINGRTLIIETDRDLPLNDFAQALVKVGVTNAVCLVSGNTVGAVTDLRGRTVMSGKGLPHNSPNISFIVWQ